MYGNEYHIHVYVFVVHDLHIHCTIALFKLLVETVFTDRSIVHTSIYGVQNFVCLIFADQWRICENCMP